MKNVFLFICKPRVQRVVGLKILSLQGSLLFRFSFYDTEDSINFTNSS